jgi:DNA primase
MSRIPDETVEQIRDSADLLEIVGESVALKRTGSDYRGPCPFHGGTNRNFSVSPKRGSFYCFVCHEKGDVFSFFMKKFGMDYPTAIREVARKTGIVIPEDSAGAAPDPREPLFEALSAAQDWYARQLLENPGASAARSYLEGRAISLNTAGELGLGFASSSREFLSAMESLSISPATLAEAGLSIKRDDGSIAARFRSRLIFPIHDLRGRVVGFGGRLIGPGEPKYLNSPETPVFRKGALLYNLHLAKHALRKEQSAIVVEGYFDALRLSLAGLENVVAPLGTAMTADQAALIKRFTNSAVLLYDSDRAGLTATFRSGDELLRNGVRVTVATLPPGEDPDSIVRKHGAAGLLPFLRDGIDFMERKIRVLQEHGWLEDLGHRRSALDKVLPTIRATTDRLTRDLYIDLVARSMGVSRESVQAEADFVPSIPQSFRQSAVVSKGPDQAAEHDSWKNLGIRTERTLLHILLMYPNWLARARGGEVQPSWFMCEEYSEIFGALTSSTLDPTTGFDPSTLSARAQLAMAHLADWEMYAVLHVDETYVKCCEELEARPLILLFRQQVRGLHAEKAFEKKAEFHAEAVRMSDEIRAQYPSPWLKHVYRKSFLLPQLKPSQRQSSTEAPPAVRPQRNVS